jgi:hypothetical protein
VPHTPGWPVSMNYKATRAERFMEEDRWRIRLPPTMPEMVTMRLAAVSPTKVRRGPRRRQDDATGRDVTSGGKEETLRFVGAVVLALWVRSS